MEWTDEGCLLNTKAYGECHALAEVFTPERGRNRALVYGGSGRTLSRILQPGNQFNVRWYAKHEDQLGSFTLEPTKSRTVAILSSRTHILTLRSLAALLIRYVPEREHHPVLYAQTQKVLDALTPCDDAKWMDAYGAWEITLLSELGYGLDLKQCAVTGQTHNLTHVSPRTGRVVCAEVAMPYQDRLLALSRLSHEQSWENFYQALNLSGYFLLSRIAKVSGDRELPLAREQLMQHIEKQCLKAKAMTA
jgi:DNA repair protein RecO (recombination protein O)